MDRKGRGYDEGTEVTKMTSTILTVKLTEEKSKKHINNGGRRLGKGSKTSFKNCKDRGTFGTYEMPRKKFVNKAESKGWR